MPGLSVPLGVQTIFLKGGFNLLKIQYTNYHFGIALLKWRKLAPGLWPRGRTASSDDDYIA